ncbi:hypothetical protein IAU59_002591 [Kwoniella sp. CBS 9459]
MSSEQSSDDNSTHGSRPDGTSQSPSQTSGSDTTGAAERYVPPERKAHELFEYFDNSHVVTTSGIDRATHSDVRSDVSKLTRIIAGATVSTLTTSDGTSRQMPGSPNDGQT